MLVDVLFETLQNLIGIRPTVKSVVAHLQITEKALYARKTRNSELTPKELIKIEQGFGLPIGSLSGVSSSDITLDFYPNVFGSCGTGLMVFDETSEKVAVTKDIIKGYSASNKYSVISARGSSMSPVINDDDKLIIQHDIYEQIIDDTVYLFRYNDELFIKRLVKNVDQIVCISENPRFQDRIIEPKNGNFSIIGKVVGLIRHKVWYNKIVLMLFINSLPRDQFSRLFFY